jgi:multicomponent Na+:H+ antiporter subunit D
MTTSLAIPPAAVLILGGLIMPLLHERLRQLLLLVLPLVTLYLIWQVPDGVALECRFLGYTLELVKGDALSRLFATIFAVMAFAGGLFALNQHRMVELAAAFCYAGSAIGIAFAGDLLTVFIFWELMAIASTLIVWSAGASARGA